MNDKDKKFRNLPAFITLLAGFITSVIAILYRFELIKTLWLLILIMTIFFILGMIMRIILDRSLRLPEEESQEEENEESEEQEQEADAGEEEKDVKQKKE